MFIDPGAGVSIIFKGTLCNMDIHEFEIVPCNVALIGYDSNMSFAMGKIPLIISASPYHFLIEFTILDMPSPYNLFMGRSWLHKLRVMEIKGNQGHSHKCEVPIVTQDNQEK